MPTVKMLPSNVEAEKCVLGAMLIRNGESIGDVQGMLEPEEFYIEAHRLIYETMLETYAEDKTIDLTILIDRLDKKGLLDKVGGVQAVMVFGNNIQTNANIKRHAHIIKEKYKYQNIGYDKLNMLRHVRFFGDIDGMMAHMKKHAEILRPRFEIVLDKLRENLDELGVIRYNRPRGGYFVCVDVLDGTAKRVVALCKEAGVSLTGAGATYPYGKDPHDSNIRIAPSFPSLEDLSSAMDIFCLCARIAALEKLNAE